VYKILNDLKQDDYWQTQKDLMDFSREVIEILIRLRLMGKTENYSELKAEVEREIKTATESYI
jgi:hypothetical protein